MSKEIKSYKEGIYFNMPEEEYFKLPFFSNSGAGLINIDPLEYWHYSPMNPKCPVRDESSAMVFGKALHSMILEPEVFEKLYVREPHPDDFPGVHILKTVEDLKEVLTDLGKPKSGNKPELIERLSGLLDPEIHLIWEEVLTEFYNDVRLNGWRVLNRSDMQELLDMKAALDNYYPRIKNGLSGGYPEVVIIWRDKDTGVMCKARLDYLRPDAIGDVKSFSLKGKKNIRKAACDAIVWERYNVQYVIYQEAVREIIKRIRAKKAVIVGEVSQEWINKFLATEEKRFFFAFIRSEAPYQCEGLELEKAFTQGASTNIYHSEGVGLFRIAINIYAECLAKYGTKPWIKEHYIKKLADEEVPSVMNQSYAS